MKVINYTPDKQQTVIRMPDERPQQTPHLNNPFPAYDAAQTIDHYIQRLEYWFGDCDDERRRFNIVMAQLPAKFFNVLAGKDFKGVKEPYTEMKNILLKEFAMSEAERVSKLLENVTLGDKRPGDLLREMMQLSATSDENLVKGLWLRQLPPNLAAQLAANIEPLETLGTTANAIYAMLNRDQINEVSSQNNTPSVLQELTETMKQLVLVVTQNQATIAALSTRPDRSRAQERGQEPSRGRDSSGDRYQGRENSPDRFRDRGRYRNQSQQRFRSRSREYDPNMDICFYHFMFGRRANHCNQPCNFNQQPPSGGRG